jgi:hypothetical protein
MRIELPALFHTNRVRRFLAHDRTQLSCIVLAMRPRIFRSYVSIKGQCTFERRGTLSFWKLCEEGGYGNFDDQEACACWHVTHLPPHT